MQRTSANFVCASSSHASAIEPFTRPCRLSRNLQSSRDTSAQQRNASKPVSSSEPSVAQWLGLGLTAATEHLGGPACFMKRFMAVWAPKKETNKPSRHDSWQISHRSISPAV